MLLASGGRVPVPAGLWLERDLRDGHHREHQKVKPAMSFPFNGAKNRLVQVQKFSKLSCISGLA